MVQLPTLIAFAAFSFYPVLSIDIDAASPGRILVPFSVYALVSALTNIVPDLIMSAASTLVSIVVAYIPQQTVPDPNWLEVLGEDLE
jgi:hypothetical protein